MRIGFRHILPVVMTVNFVVLVVVGDGQQEAFKQYCVQVAEQRKLKPSLPPGEAYVTDCDILGSERRTPRPIEVALQTSLPATGLAVLSALMIRGSETQDIVGWVLIGLGGVFLWFAVGCWFDRLLGRFEPEPPWRRVVTIVVAVIAVMSLPVALGTWSGHIHHGWMFPFGLVLWPAFGMLVLYHRRKYSKLRAS